MEAVKLSCVACSVEALPISDIHEKGPSSVSAAPMDMVKPNRTRVETLPLTPPTSAPPSAHFSEKIVIEHASSLNIPTDANSNGLIISPSESIDINVCELSQDILVALLYRDTEIRDLFVRNQDFFDTVKLSIFEDKERWEYFLKVLYSKREEIPDSEWMNSISEFLSPNPPFLVKFKQIIGFYEDDDNDDIIQEESEELYSCESMNHGWVDVSPVRDLLGKFETAYPQFFINVRESLSEGKQRKGSLLGGNYICNDNPLLHPNVESEDSSETPFEEFKRILYAPRSEMDDSEWETAVYLCLDQWSRLIDQFEEIVKYEIEIGN